MWAIYKKELKSYFLSPIGYITIGVLLVVFSVFFYQTVVQIGAYDMGNLYFNSARYGLLIIVPLVTMRMFPEERRNGTEQLLLTSPKSITQIVLGKYLAAITLIAVNILSSLIYFVILSFFTEPHLMPTLIAMLGFFLLSMASVGIGMFIASLTENQIIAAVTTLVFFVAAWFIPNINESLSFIDIMTNYYKFPAGLVAISELTNLIGLIIMFVLFTIIIMQRRKSIK